MRSRALVLVAGVFLAPPAARADQALTPAQIGEMETRGWITPAFVSAARQLIDARQAAAQADEEARRLKAQLPGLRENVAAEDAKLAQLKARLEVEEHPEETDFTALQQALHKQGAAPQDNLALAQAYIWTYPQSPHLADAMQDLQQLQKTIADQAQAEARDAAAQTAAQARLLARVKAHDLDLGSWRSFLEDKTTYEVTGYLGPPTGKDDSDHWIYRGSWTTDPSTGQKAGLEIGFNGGRVQSVAPIAAAAP